MSIVTTVLAALAGIVLLITGVFSVVTLLWDDLLESDSEQSRDRSLSSAA